MVRATCSHCSMWLTQAAMCSQGTISWVGRKQAQGDTRHLCTLGQGWQCGMHLGIRSSDRTQPAFAAHHPAETGWVLCEGGVAGSFEIRHHQHAGPGSHEAHVREQQLVAMLAT